MGDWARQVSCTFQTTGDGYLESVAALPTSKTRDFSRWSQLEEWRSKQIPELPEILAGFPEFVPVDEAGEVVDAEPELLSNFPNCCGLPVLRAVPPTGLPELPDEPHRIGIASVASTVAAPGTHNVILGLRTFFDKSDAKVWGIRNLAKGNQFEIVSGDVQYFLNQAGSDLLPTIPLLRLTDAALNKLGKLCADLCLTGLVLICSPAELSQVARIAEYLNGCVLGPPVVAVLHSVKGNVHLPKWFPTSIGFDSAVGALAEVTGNIALSRQSLGIGTYHFVCVGSPPLTLEIAMQTHPTLCYIGEDIGQRGLTLRAIIDEVADVIVERHHDHGLTTGIILVSDDFFEALVEMRQLRDELNKLRLEKLAAVRSEEAALQLLPQELGEFFAMLPADVCHSLVFRSDANNMPLLNLPEAERELATLVARCLACRAEKGERSLAEFMPHPHNLRHLMCSPMPTLLDSRLGYALGHVAGLLLQQRKNSYVASLANLGEPCEKWDACAVPLTHLLALGPQTTLVPRGPKLASDYALFGIWQRLQARWRFQGSIRQPGPVQFCLPPGGHPLKWSNFTIQAEYLCIELEDDEAESPKLDAKWVPLEVWRQLVRPRPSLLSSLQKWRMEYQPELPQVLRGPFRIAESDNKTRVCADPSLVRSAFPGLWRTASKAAMIVAATEEVNVLQMLPNASSSASIYDLTTESSSPSLIRKESSQARLDRRVPSMRIGIALVGRAGPGVNNVIQGLFDYLQTVGGTVICIALGIEGLIKDGFSFELDEETLAPFRNQGGCNLLGQSGPEDLRRGDLAACAATVTRLALDGLVLWGGCNGHSWTPRLAEYFVQEKINTCVVGVPASVQSDLPIMEQTLGYDSMCKLLASVVGNLAVRAASSGKMWCFVRIPGRSLSHIVAEVALETHPHVVLVPPSDGTEQLSLLEVTQIICNTIELRSRDDKNYGIVLIPDQLLASVREMRQLFEEVAEIRMMCPEALDCIGSVVVRDFAPVRNLLSPLTRSLFKKLPERICAQILGLAFDDVAPRSRTAASAGARHTWEPLDLASVDTEVILQSLVEAELTRRVLLGTYKGSFQSMTYSMAYHGRAAMPTNFDCDLGYTIGYAAGIFVSGHRTGLLVDVTKLKEDVRKWEVRGTPLLSLQTIERDSGHPPVCQIRPRLRLHYDVGYKSNMPEPLHRTVISPGPVQFAGPCSSAMTQSLCMPQLQRVRQMARTEQLIAELKGKASAGCPVEVLHAVRLLLQGGTELIHQL